LTLDFSKKRSIEAGGAPAARVRAKPVNWRSRPIQIRLMIAVVVILSAASIGESVVSGRFWRLLDGATNGEPTTPVETRLPAKRTATLDELAMITAPLSPRPWTRQETAASVEAEVRADFWEKLYESLTVKQRDQLEASLRFALRDASGPLGTSDRSELLVSLERHAASYEQKALEELGESKVLTEAKQEEFKAAIGKVLGEWRDSIAPAVSKVLKGESIVENDKKSLRNMEGKWNAMSLAEVKDDASSPASDFVAWFGLFDSLKHDANLLNGASEVSYTELFDQSARFRGQPIVVKGVIRAAEYQKASANLYGIEGYYVCWIRPDNYVDAPVRVFSLRAPTGIGLQVNDENLGELVGKKCELKGVFFKRMAYRAQDDIRAVPSILSKEVQLVAVEDSLQKENNSMTLSMLLVLAAVVGGLLLVMYAFSDRKRVKVLPEKMDLPASAPKEPS
jgi:hypothetical protein